MKKGTSKTIGEKKSHNKAQRGFTRTELAVVLATVTFIGAMGLSVLGDNRERSERVVCGNNLRQIGRAFNMWASDHGGENPFWTHYDNGGTYFANGTPGPITYSVPGGISLPPALRNNAWFHFLFINQELGTPGILVCPSDQNKVRARVFTNSANGLYSANFQNRAISYFVGFHALSQHPSSMLSGDRTLKADTLNGNCTANVGTVYYITSTSGWISGLHNAGGNLLLNDGHVEELSNSGLGRFLHPPGTSDEFTAAHHLAVPY